MVLAGRRSPRTVATASLRTKYIDEMVKKRLAIALMVAAVALTTVQVASGAPFVDPAEPQSLLSQAGDTMTETELEVLGIQSRAELETVRRVLDQLLPDDRPIASVIGANRAQLVELRPSDDTLSPFALATVVLGLMSLAMVTVAATRRQS